MSFIKKFLDFLKLDSTEIYEESAFASRENKIQKENYIQNEIKRAKFYANIVNTTTNQKEFYLALNKVTQILYDLSNYETDIKFLNSPEEDLKRLVENRDKIIQKFNERVLEAERKKNFNLDSFMKECNEYAESKDKTILDSMSGKDFEYFCADILRKNGFNNVDVTQGSGDHGIDILAEKDNIEYAIQCKCYSFNVGNSAIQQANAGKSIYKRDIAVVLTNQYFTPQAKDEAKILGVKLWDRDKLNELIEISK